MPVNNRIRGLFGLDGVTVALALVTLPLILISGMAIRTVVTDRAASQALESEASRQIAHAHGVRLSTMLERNVAAQLEKVEKALADTTLPVSFLRRIVHEQSPIFVLLFEEGRRIYPPEESHAVLLQERQMLFSSEPAVLSLLQKMSGDRRGFVWTKLRGHPALLTCQTIRADGVLCIASMLEELRRAIDDSFLETHNYATRRLSLVDPWDDRQFSVGDSIDPGGTPVSVELSGPLRAWKLFVDTGTDTMGSSALIAAIVIPMMLGWGIALLSLIRVQSKATQQHRERADSAARLSHDLRTPIANLALYVDLISRYGQNAPDVRRCCNALEKEIARLALIAESTIRRSRGLPPPTVKDSPAHTDHVIQSLVERYEPLMEKADCTITFDAGAPSAMTDDRLTLERILVNVIDNARSHAAGANVKIATKKSEGQLIISITDDGRRDPASEGDHQNGYGLGFQVIEELTRSRGGAFKANIDEAGSYFEVLLPMSEKRSNASG